MWGMQRESEGRFYCDGWSGNRERGWKKGGKYSPFFSENMSEVQLKSKCTVFIFWSPPSLHMQARPRDVVSVPALHDAMGITMETVQTTGETGTQETDEEIQNPLAQTLTLDLEHRESSDQ